MKGGKEETIGMEASSRQEPISSPANSESQITGSSSSSAPSTKSANALNNHINKANSCKGCLLYSSRLKAESRNPVCLGLTRSLPEVPQFVVGRSEMEATEEGRNLTDFRYACVGYSLFIDRKKQDSSTQGTQTELPVCVGLEMLVDRGEVAPADSSQAPATATPIYGRENREDVHGLPQRRGPKQTNSAAEDYFVRFSRNANLVANGVAKNIRKVGNNIKQSLDAILDRRAK